MSDALDHWLNLGQSAELRRLDALVKEQAQEIERLKAQRVPLTEEQIRDTWDVHVFPVFGKDGINPLFVFARAIEAAHGIHPLQRLADLSKELGEKL